MNTVAFFVFFYFTGVNSSQIVTLPFWQTRWIWPNYLMGDGPLVIKSTCPPYFAQHHIYPFNLAIKEWADPLPFFWIGQFFHLSSSIVVLSG